MKDDINKLFETGKKFKEELNLSDKDVYENLKTMEDIYSKYKGVGHYDFEIDERLFNKDIIKIMEEQSDNN